MTRFKTIFLLTFGMLNGLCWGQKTIKGTFVYSEGFVYESLTLTKVVLRQEDIDDLNNIWVYA